jgi:X-Pro dipeptidyl-peptidase
VSVALYPHGGGSGAGPLTTERGPNQGTERLRDDVGLGGPDLAMAPSSEQRLLYATPTLTSAVHVSGVARVTIRVASDRPAANLSVWLVALPWTQGAPITDNVITRGWADPQNHASITDGEPLVPGEFYDVTFDLQPDDQVIPAGQRIGLMIFSSDRDFTLWPEPGTELTIDLDGTVLDLPVVGGARALARPVG